VNPTQRLCWHTNSGNVVGGWRSGANTLLNFSTAFRRAIYVPAAVVPGASRAGFGATPAIFVHGLGITCDSPRAGFVRSGFAGRDRHVQPGLYPLYVPQP
jgi:hypothetical protein